MRTDTERLDWLEKNPSAVRRGIDSWEIDEAAQHGWPTCGAAFLRVAIDAAMDAAEGEELEAAWRWFRKSECTLRRWYTNHGHYIWQVWEVSGDGMMSEGENRDQVVLSAYRASRKKEKAPEGWQCKAPCMTHNPDSYNVCQSCKRSRT